MKKLPLGLTVVYLLFISIKSIFTPVTFSELGIFLALIILVISQKYLTLKHKFAFRNYLLSKEEIELKRPQMEDPDIAILKKENEISALRLRKYMTEQEYSKREISRAIEKKVGEGGLIF